MKFTDKTAITKLVDEIETALRGVGDRHGVAITMGRGKYTATTFEIALRLATVDHNGVAMTREREDFKSLAAQCGLRPEDIDAEITLDGVRYKIVGLARKAKINPVLLMRADGAMVRAAAGVVARGLGRTEAEIAAADLSNIDARCRARGEGPGDVMARAAERGEGWAVNMIAQLNGSGGLPS